MIPLQLMPHERAAVREKPESWWIQRAVQNGVSPKKYRDRRRNGIAREDAILAKVPNRSTRWPEETMSSIAREHGIRPRSVHEWYRRHPEHKDKDPREVIEWMVANKRRWKK